MTPAEFNALQYGNVIANAQGGPYIVTNITRDPSGKPVHVGLLPAINASMAADYAVVSKDRTETALVGKTVFATP